MTACGGAHPVKATARGPLQQQVLGGTTLTALAKLAAVMLTIPVAIAMHARHVVLGRVAIRRAVCHLELAAQADAITQKGGDPALADAHDPKRGAAREIGVCFHHPCADFAHTPGVLSAASASPSAPFGLFARKREDQDETVWNLYQSPSRE